MLPETKSNFSYNAIGGSAPTPAEKFQELIKEVHDINVPIRTLFASTTAGTPPPASFEWTHDDEGNIQYKFGKDKKKFDVENIASVKQFLQDAKSSFAGSKPGKEVFHDKVGTDGVFETDAEYNKLLTGLNIPDNDKRCEAIGEHLLSHIQNKDNFKTIDLSAVLPRLLINIMKTLHATKKRFKNSAGYEYIVPFLDFNKTDTSDAFTKIVNADKITETNRTKAIREFFQRIANHLSQKPHYYHYNQHIPGRPSSSTEPKKIQLREALQIFKQLPGTKRPLTTHTNPRTHSAASVVGSHGFFATPYIPMEGPENFLIGGTTDADTAGIPDNLPEVVRKQVLDMLNATRKSGSTLLENSFKTIAKNLELNHRAIHKDDEDTLEKIFKELQEAEMKYATAIVLMNVFDKFSNETKLNDGRVGKNVQLTEMRDHLVKHKEKLTRKILKRETSLHGVVISLNEVLDNLHSVSDPAGAAADDAY